MVVITVFIILVSFLIIASNIVNIIVIRVTQKLPQNSRYFMLSLAVADLGVGFLSLAAVNPSLKGHLTYSKTICRVTGGLQFCLAAASIHSLLSISIERFLAISFPLRYQSYVTGKRCIITIVIIWVTVSSWISFLATRTDPEYYTYSEGSFLCLPNCRGDGCAALLAPGIMVFILIPSVLMPTIYIYIMHVSFTHSRKIRSRQINHNSRNPDQNIIRVEGSTKKNFRAAKLACAVTGAFYIAYIPFACFRIKLTITGKEMPPVMEFIFTWLSVSNSLWNFIIYSVMSTAFRSSLIRLFQTKCLRKTYVEPFTSDSMSMDNPRNMNIKTIT